MNKYLTATLLALLIAGGGGLFYFSGDGTHVKDYFKLLGNTKHCGGDTICEATFLFYNPKNKTYEVTDVDFGAIHVNDQSNVSFPLYLSVGRTELEPNGTNVTVMYPVNGSFNVTPGMNVFRIWTDKKPSDEVVDWDTSFSVKVDVLGVERNLKWSARTDSEWAVWDKSVFNTSNALANAVGGGCASYACMFDGNEGNYWQPATAIGAPGWVMLRLTNQSKFNVDNFRIIYYDTNYDVDQGQFYGSNDIDVNPNNGTWVYLANFVDNVSAAGTTVTNFTNTNAYRWYVWNLTTVTSPANPAIREIYFGGDLTNDGSGGPLVGIYWQQNVSNQTAFSNSTPYIFSIKFNATNASPDCIVQNYTSNNSNISIDFGTGWVNVTGPNASKEGVHNVKFSAADNCSNIVNQSLTFTITNPFLIPSILNASKTSNGCSGSKNYSDCFDEMVNSQSSSGNVTKNINGNLVVPWYSSSTQCGVGQLQSGGNCNIGTVNMSQYCEVSDEHSVACLNIAMGNNQTQMDRCYSAINSMRGSYGQLPGWRCVVNESTNYLNCTDTRVNSNGDSASDATARYIIGLYTASNNSLFSDVAKKALYKELASNLSRDMVSYEIQNTCYNSSMGNGPVCYWLAGGANVKSGGMGSGDYSYTGYWGDAISAMTFAYRATGNTTYLSVANNLSLAYLQAAKWDGVTFTVPPGKSFKWMNITGGNSLPNASCTNTCGPNQWDSSDAPRAYSVCEGLYYLNIVGAANANLSAYCAVWDRRMMRNASIVPVQYYSNGTPSGSNQSSFFAQGLQSQALLGANSSNFEMTLRNSTEHYTSSNNWDFTACFGVYQEGPVMRAFGEGIGRTLPLFVVSGYSPGSNPSLFLTTTALELGTLVNASASLGVPVCIDVDAPGYGVNSTCGASPQNLTINITSFRNTAFNDSSSFKNLSFGSNGLSNKTSYVSQNSKDVVSNFSVYLKGYFTNSTFPTNIKVFVNDTLAASPGAVFNTTSFSINAFNDSSTSVSTNFSIEETKVVGYIHLPKGAVVSFATLTANGSSGFTTQEVANSVTLDGTYIIENYTKPSGSNNITKWQVSMGENSGPQLTANYTLPDLCWNANPSRISVRVRGYCDKVGLFAETNASCWNGSTYINVHSSSMNSCSDGANTASVSRAYDSDYSTSAQYNVYQSKWSSVYNPLHDHTFYEDAMVWSQFIYNPWFEAGAITGSRDWNYTGTFNTTNVTNNFSAKVNAYLASCTPGSDGFCDVPLWFYSNGGTLVVNNLTVNYTYNVNPVVLNSSVVNAFLRRSTGIVDVPVTFQNDRNGTLEVTNLSVLYVGGNKSMRVTAHDYLSTVSNSSNVTVVASTWNYSLPRNVVRLEFIPSNPSAKNVSAYGQTNSVPFLNITNTGYGWSSFNFSVYVNSTDPCVNLTVAGVANASQAVQSNGTWTYLYGSVPPGSSGGVWLYANYACNTSAWRVWRPRLSFRACAVNTSCSEERS